jgi:4-hydroxy-tetrahydrodipicolinate reductase
MKIALLGYGRMGQEIEKVAVSRGHKIVVKADIDGFSDEEIKKADVAIDFSVPESAVSNIKKTLQNGVPVVVGTTGWLEQYSEVVDFCNKNNGGFIYASNFSLGVNIFFELNKKLAKMLSTHEQYAVEMEEIHHTKKLDAPSGTAITLAEGIIENSNFTDWKLDEANDNEIAIVAKRIGNVPGTHTVKYTSEIDDIEIKHTAHNRKGFALGAVVAAEWLKDKHGIFNMKDVLGL